MISDLGVLLWCVVWIVLAGMLRERVLDVQDTARRAEAAGTKLNNELGDASAILGSVPLLGGTLASPLRTAGEAGTDLVAVGRSAQSAVGTTATMLYALVLVLCVGVVLVWWVVNRLRWANDAQAASVLRGSREGLQVLGLRAAGRAPVGALGAVLQSRPAGVDQQTLEALGTLELQRLGVRPHGG